MGEREPDDLRRRRRGLLEHVAWKIAVVAHDVVEAILDWTITAVEKGIELVRFLSRITWRLVMWTGVCLTPLLVGSVGHEFVKAAPGWFLWLVGWLLMVASVGLTMVIFGAVFEFFSEGHLDRQDVPLDPATIEFKVIMALLIFYIVTVLIVMIVAQGGYSFQSPLLRLMGSGVAE